MSVGEGAGTASFLYDCGLFLSCFFLRLYSRIILGRSRFPFYRGFSFVMGIASAFTRREFVSDSMRQVKQGYVVAVRVICGNSNGPRPVFCIKKYETLLFVYFSCQPSFVALVVSLGVARMEK